MRKILLTLLAIGGLALTAAAQDSGELRDRITVTGWGQTYYDAAFGPDVRGTNTFAINKINLVAKGQITDRWSMGILFQMHSPAKLKELWLQYTLMPQLRVRIGEMKTPFGMENQIPPSLLPLTSGWTMPTCYFAGVSGDPLYRGTSGRDIGLELSGDLWGKILSYKLAVMNGQGLNTLDLGTTKMYGGALYVRPYRGITLHTSYLGGEMHAMGTRGAIQAGNAYKRSSISAGLSLDYSPVTLSAEYPSQIQMRRSETEPMSWWWDTCRRASSSTAQSIGSGRTGVRARASSPVRWVSRDGSPRSAAGSLSTASPAP